MKKILAFLFGIGLIWFGIWLSLKLWEGGTGLLFGAGLIVGGIYLFASIFEDDTLRSAVIKICFVLAAASILIGVLWGRDLSTFGNAGGVCSGHEIHNSVPYTDVSSIHPLRVIGKLGDQNLYFDDYPDGWRAKSMKELQIVACLEEEWRIIEKCSYGRFGISSDAELIRELHIVYVTVYESYSGQKLDEISIIGKNPRPCADNEKFTEGQKVKIVKGEPVHWKEIFSRLQKWVVP